MICITCGKNEAINDYYEECEGCIDKFQIEKEKRNCYQCVHFGICEMSNEMSRFIDGKIKEYPAIANEVNYLITKLAIYCRKFWRN